MRRFGVIGLRFLHLATARFWCLALLLKYVEEKGNYWYALPGEVARWWWERSKRRLVQENGTWRIVPEWRMSTNRFLYTER